jgi:hypothetical protein
MPLSALMLLACASQPGAALSATFAGELHLALAGDDNGPPPGSPYPPPPPLVQDPVQPAPPDQEPDERAPPPPVRRSRPLPESAALPAPVGDVGARLLWGIGLHFGAGEDQITDIASGGTTASAGPSAFSSATGGIGLYFRVGAELNDLWGIDAELSGGSVIEATYLRGALTFDVSPTDLVTFAVGPLVRDDWVLVPCGCLGDATVSMTSIGGTARLDLHPGASRSANGRGAVTVGLIGDVGATVGANGFCNGAMTYAGGGPAWAFYLAFGYARY